MEAASLVNATTVSRTKADSASAKTQEGGHGEDAFAALLNQAEVQAEVGRSNGERSLIGQETKTREHRAGHLVVQGSLRVIELTPEQFGSLTVSERSNLTESVESARESTELESENDQLVEASSPELVGWLAALLTVPIEAGEDALSKTLPEAATNGADKPTKDQRLPDEGVSAEEAQAREDLTAVTSGLVSTSYLAQLQEGNLGGPVTEVRGQLSTPRATDPSEATKKLPPVTEQGQPQLNAIAELGLGQPVAARQATMTTAPASSKVGEEIRPASMAPTEHADALARPHPYRPSQAAVRPTVPMEETSKPRVGQEAVNKPEQVAAGPQAIVKPFHQEPSNSQPQQGINPVFSNQGTRETLPSAPSASLARLESVIQPSVHSPAFAPAFSARIATLARDGLELARVHLNPVDMGPVSVQLSLEGQQVRVDMTADVAATRRVLEQALPTLAGALREAGFTLSGGGVHQPPTDARQSSSQDAGANSSSNPQGAGTPDNLSSSAGGAGGQGSAANPFREDPQNRGAFTNSRLLTVGEDGALSATGTSTGLEGRPATGLVDVFA